GTEAAIFKLDPQNNEILPTWINPDGSRKGSDDWLSPKNGVAHVRVFTTKIEENIEDFDQEELGGLVFLTGVYNNTPGSKSPTTHSANPKILCAVVVRIKARPQTADLPPNSATQTDNSAAYDATQNDVNDVNTPYVPTSAVPSEVFRCDCGWIGENDHEFFGTEEEQARALEEERRQRMAWANHIVAERERQRLRQGLEARKPHLVLPKNFPIP
ncbi:12959_t:CDS:2, partial [Acaulospora colombiana]